MSIPSRLARLLKSYGNAALDKVRQFDLAEWDHVLDDWRDPERRDAATRPGREEFEAALEELEGQLRAAREGRQAGPAEAAKAARGGGARADRPGSRAATAAGQADLKRHYRTLGLAPGADFQAVKGAYRRLMRQYHPDVHSADPVKQRTATEIAQRITEAYRMIAAAHRLESAP